MSEFGITREYVGVRKRLWRVCVCDTLQVLTRRTPLSVEPVDVACRLIVDESGKIILLISSIMAEAAFSAE